MKGSIRLPETVDKLFCKQTPPQTVTASPNQLDVGFLPAGYRNGQRFCKKLLSEITYSFQKANIGPHMTEKWMKMGGNVGFLRRQSQNRQRRRPLPFHPHVVVKERACFLLQHFRAEPHLHERSKQPMLYFLEKAAMLTTFWL